MESERKMMVNEFKNSSVPWQSTVPQQMPWMSPYDPAVNSLQFGQPTSNYVSNIGVYSSVYPVNQPASVDQGLLAQIQPQASQSYPTPQTNLSTPVVAQSSLNLSNTPNFSVYPQNPEVHDYIKQSPLMYMPSASASTSTWTTGSACQPQKRTSVEMEDDTITTSQPPTKQLLSESKLFKQFGSLQLNQDFLKSGRGSSSESDDSDEDNISQGVPLTSQDQSRDEFNRYVYLLFKDRNHQGERPFSSSNSPLDRLAREERDKLSKAVVLWTPPPKHNLFGQQDDDEDQSSTSDDELSYRDHKDFLKKPANQTVTITEIFDSPSDEQLAQDEMMLD